MRAEKDMKNKVISLFLKIHKKFFSKKLQHEKKLVENIALPHEEIQRQKEEKFSGRTLYFSNVALREKQECYLRKKGIFASYHKHDLRHCYCRREIRGSYVLWEIFR